MDREYTGYDTVGSAASAATLTAAYTGNRKTLLCKYLTQLHLDILYTPNALSSNAFALILVEVSNDDGATFFPVTAVVYATTETDAFANSGLTTTSGTPVIFPGSKTSTGGTAISGYIDAQVIGTHVRVSVKESVGSNFGTIYIRSSLQS